MSDIAVPLGMLVAWLIAVVLLFAWLPGEDSVRYDLIMDGQQYACVDHDRGPTVCEGVNRNIPLPRRGS